MGRYFESPQSATQGLPGSEWPRALVDWVNEADNTEKTHGANVVNWNRTAAGLVTYTDHQWKHLNPREVDQLVHALKETGMQKLNPTKKQVKQYTEQLAAVMRSSSTIKGLKAENATQNKKGAPNNQWQPKGKQDNWQQGPGKWNANYGKGQQTPTPWNQPGKGQQNHGRTPPNLGKGPANWSAHSNFTKGKKGSDANQNPKGKNQGCFVCGSENHWARECTAQNQRNADQGKSNKGKNAKSGNKNGKGKQTNYTDTLDQRWAQGNGEAPAGGAGWA